MKTTYSLLAFIVILFAISCQSNSTDQENPETEIQTSSDDTQPSSPGISDTISLATANEWVCNFQSFMSAGISTAQWDSIKVDGFLIPEVDMTEILAEPGVENVRAYLGLRTDGPSDTMKLILVGVDARGDDMLALIADFSSPCPPDCGSEHSITDCTE